MPAYHSMPVGAVILTGGHDPIGNCAHAPRTMTVTLCFLVLPRFPRAPWLAGGDEGGEVWVCGEEGLGVWTVGNDFQAALVGVEQAVPDEHRFKTPGV